MIEHLRLRAAAALASCNCATFVTCGPSGPQASRVRCRARQTTLQVFVPRSSDHLFNLEHVQEVVVLTEKWELRGTVRIIAGDTSVHQEYALPEWYVGVDIQPIRLQILHDDGQRIVETIDF